ncbi:conserved hypothetical protein [Vibrio crassostreae]|nr:conserved hypothetical protein [Vibrio crassostreae]CAK2276281.1 conserved hypothetical protein [Vibrio crassostreae]CAK2412650.1 conserved hypothetical protein [Vibrio crassostreae]CAK2646444.1 conserved hypothetical protein [Vibrio crassostreae]
MAKPRLTTSQFIKKSQQRWGDKYGYQKTDYINSRTPLVLFCFKHQHYFTQTPKAHFIAKKECCPRCYKECAGTFQNQWRETKQEDPILMKKETWRTINKVFSSH